jgi:hypothetical protein
MSVRVLAPAADGDDPGGKSIHKICEAACSNVLFLHQIACRTTARRPEKTVQVQAICHKVERAIAATIFDALIDWP